VRELVSGSRVRTTTWISGLTVRPPWVLPEQVAVINTSHNIADGAAQPSSTTPRLVAV
jgi:hypothetical protein